MLEILINILIVALGVAGGKILYDLLAEGRKNLAKWVLQKRGDIKKFFRKKKKARELIKLQKARESFKQK
jgi:hypothetical protein